MAKFFSVPILLAVLFVVGCTGVSSTSAYNADDGGAASVSAGAQAGSGVGVGERAGVLSASSDMKKTQIMITNYGYYLFNCVPLFSGGIEDGSFALFSDKVNVDSAMRTLKIKCEEMNAARICDVQSTKTSTCCLSWVPYIGTTLGLYCYKEVQISAVVSAAAVDAKIQGEGKSE